MIKSLLLTLASGVAVWKLSALHENRQRRLHPEDYKPRSENRWEGEGGALPEVGAQLRSAPQRLTASV